MPNRRKIADQSIEKFKNKIREITNRNYSINFEDRIRILRNYINGWKAYFDFCETKHVLRDLDSWIRRCLRCVLWKQWKTYKKRQYELVNRGVDPTKAYSPSWSSKGPWNIAHTPAVRIALPNKFFDSIGLPRLWSG
jgi:RNA-directed DNA polymerase